MFAYASFGPRFFQTDCTLRGEASPPRQTFCAFPRVPALYLPKQVALDGTVEAAIGEEGP
jgi:hypothetical protein